MFYYDICLVIPSKPIGIRKTTDLIGSSYFTGDNPKMHPDATQDFTSAKIYRRCRPPEDATSGD
jgi:hypothetical protein